MYFLDKQVCTWYNYLAVALIWQFYESCLYCICHLGCSMDFFPCSTQNRQLKCSPIAFLELLTKYSAMPIIPCTVAQSHRCHFKAVIAMYVLVSVSTYTE